MTRTGWAVLAACVTLACESPPPADVVVFAPPSLVPALTAYAAELDGPTMEIRESNEPAAQRGTAGALLEIAVVDDASCAECFSIDHGDAGPLVHGGGVLGAQYGLTALFEAMGFRFFHPNHTRVPAAVAAPPASDPVYGVMHAPEMAQRGLHLHTLHPIEAYLAILEPSEEAFADARRIVDWIVKSRGNFVRWYLLSNFKTDVPGLREHVTRVIEYAHLRGLEVGITVQLFRGANLQLAYDLTDGVDGAEQQIHDNLARLDGLGIDELALSFGEFSGEEPERFIVILNAAVAEAYALWPDITVTASVHVGNRDELRVDYGGQTGLLYYFLVQFADPRIVPEIHTVMYYDLFDPVSGAYGHTDFHEHRDYLYSRLMSGDPVAYYPESAYWIAFDNSVPTYLPVYLRTRFRDLDGIRRDALAMGLSPLDRHTLFTSGWELGYWQTDYLVLRMGYALPERLEDAIDEMLAPLGTPAASSAIATVADLQYEHLVRNELGPYLAGRDATIDAGFALGIFAAPDRVSFEGLMMMSPTEREDFAARVLDNLDALAAGTATADASFDPGDDPWLGEIHDGLSIDVHRARFVAALYRAVIDAADGTDPMPRLTEAETELAAAEVDIDRRIAGFHDREPQRLIARRDTNATLYHYGYLREVALSCFWVRELAQARNLLLGTDERVPGCTL
ncbi:MAG: hypothetical protein AB7S26_16875 [Sandaracinaceae bacterium]